LVAVCTLALVTAGALVTSNDAALAVPDWPLSWGRLVPPLEGGIRYDFAHRVLAAAVAILIAILAFWTQAREPRPWMRKLAWSALAAVLAQAALGGALVKLVDPKLLAISHACLAQLCFGLTVAAETERWDSFVITEEDYIRFLSRMNNAVPAAFREYFSSRAFLFLGYSLRDWNMRVLLKEVSVSEITSWAILYQPSAFERTLWERRKVRMYDLKLEEFVAKIRAESGL
jgi:hypothetical protein